MMERGMGTLTKPLVTGLTLAKHSEAKGEVSLGVRVLISGKDGDLLERDLHRGQTLPVLPPIDKESPCEVFYILAGEMSVNGRTLVPHQLFVSSDLSSPDKLTALTPARVLHFSAPAVQQVTPPETAFFDSGSLQLLYSSGHTELSLMTLKKDMRFFIVPNETPDQIIKEVYYLLQGQLSFQNQERSTVLSASDYIIAEGLETPVAFQGMQDVTLLYFSFQPNFRGVGLEAEELMHLAETIEQKDGYTADHCKRIQDLSLRTGEAMGLSHDRLYLLNYGAYLHDVGKAKLPEGMLQKPGKLTDDEWVVMKQHPTLGRELLEHSFVQDVGAIVEQHHERLDGSGYPKGLKGLEISLEAYIIAVADTFDAMTTDRPYRKALPEAVAVAELYKYAGQHYPKEVVETFLKANGLK
jgi:putative nucleotidyltransferase with HDIG domain